MRYEYPLFLFLLILMVTGINIYVIRLLAFNKRRDQEMNLSEAIHIGGLIAAAVFIFYVVYDQASSLYLQLANAKGIVSWWPVIKGASFFSALGLIYLLLVYFAARFLGMMIFGQRKDFIEFRGDNRPFALVRAVLLVALAYLVQNVFVVLSGALLPNERNPVYM